VVHFDAHAVGLGLRRGGFVGGVGVEAAELHQDVFLLLL
jgi:hypothetical protein